MKGYDMSQPGGMERWDEDAKRGDTMLEEIERLNALLNEDRWTKYYVEWATVHKERVRAAGEGITFSYEDAKGVLSMVLSEGNTWNEEPHPDHEVLEKIWGEVNWEQVLEIIFPEQAALDRGAQLQERQ